MRIKITESIDDLYASLMLGVSAAGSTRKSFVERSRQQPTMMGWFAVMDFASGKWVEVEMAHLFGEQFNIGDPPGFTPPADRHPMSTGARVALRYVEAIDFSPEFQTADEYLEAVHERYVADWPGSIVSAELLNRIASGALKDETPKPCVLTVGLSQIAGRDAVCHVSNNGVRVYTAQIPHGAADGLGGYDLGDLESAREAVRSRCVAWANGYEAAAAEFAKRADRKTTEEQP